MLCKNWEFGDVISIKFLVLGVPQLDENNKTKCTKLTKHSLIKCCIHVKMQLTLLNIELVKLTPFKISLS